MNQILLNLQSSWKNKHVSIPAMMFIVCEAGAIWLPQYQDQFRLTGKLLIGYTALAAANSGPVPPPEVKAPLVQANVNTPKSP